LEIKSLAVPWAEGAPEELRLETTPEHLQRRGRPHLLRRQQAAGAAAAKAQSPSPMVECCVRRPSSAEVIAERSEVAACREPTGYRCAAAIGL